MTTIGFSLRTTSSSSSSTSSPSSLFDGTVGKRRFGGSVSVVILGVLLIVTLPVSDLVDGIRVIRTNGAAAFNVDDVTDGLRSGKGCRFVVAFDTPPPFCMVGVGMSFF